MAKKSSGNKSSNKSSSGSSNTGKSERKKIKPLTPIEARKIIKETAEEEKVKILAELNLNLLNSGNTIDVKSLEKQIKKKYGIDFSVEKINKQEINLPVDSVELNQVKEQ
jgi:hypothetical protein